jgi:hypothetical protein
MYSGMYGKRKSFFGSCPLPGMGGVGWIVPRLREFLSAVLPVNRLRVTKVTVSTGGYDVRNVSYSKKHFTINYYR